MAGGLLPTPIATPIMFPFEPDGSDSIKETIEFRTDIITSHNDTEMRTALRRRPVTKLGWKINAMAAGESGLLAGMLYRQVANRWYVPLWQHARIPTAIAGGVYSVDMTDHRYDYTGKVLVWKSPTVWDLMTFASAQAGSVTLTGATSFAHTVGQVVVVPLGIGSLPQSYSLSRMNEVAVLPVEFELDPTNTSLVTALVPTQLFGGVEVISIIPDSESGTEAESATLTSERIGGNGGPFYIRPYATSPIFARKAYWVLQDRAARLKFRQWLYQRRGRKTPFWVPTFQTDLQLVTPAAANAGSIDVAFVDFANRYFGATGRVHISIMMPDGTILPRTVTSSTLPNATTDRLILNAVLPSAVPLNARISLLVYARLSDDAIVMEHVTRDITVVTASFTELPRETPP